MPQRTQYIRNADLAAWDLIENKSEWIHNKMVEDGLIKEPSQLEVQIAASRVGPKKNTRATAAQAAPEPLVAEDDKQPVAAEDDLPPPYEVRNIQPREKYDLDNPTPGVIIYHEGEEKYWTGSGWKVVS